MNHCYSPLACPCGNCRRKKQDISTPKCPKCHSHFYLPYIVASATTKTISVCIHCAFDLCSKHDGDLYIAPNHELNFPFLQSCQNQSLLSILSMRSSLEDQIILNIILFSGMVNSVLSRNQSYQTFFLFLKINKNNKENVHRRTSGLCAQEGS